MWVNSLWPDPTVSQQNNNCQEFNHEKDNWICIMEPSKLKRLTSLFYKWLYPPRLNKEAYFSTSGNSKTIGFHFNHNILPCKKWACK